MAGGEGSLMLGWWAGTHKVTTVAVTPCHTTSQRGWRANVWAGGLAALYKVTTVVLATYNPTEVGGPLELQLGLQL